MEHYPDAIILIQANLDEVVAGPKRPQVPSAVVGYGLGVFLDDALVALAQIRPGPCNSIGYVVPRPTIILPTMIRAPMGHSSFDGRSQPLKIVGQA